MKKSARSMDEVNALALRIQNIVLDMEHESRNTEMKWETVLLEVASLIEMTGKDNMSYARERAIRLQSLLKNFQKQILQIRQDFSLFHRQIDKILDMEISDYFDPALNRRIDDIMDYRVKEDLQSKKRNRLLGYRLNGMTFAVHGKVLRHLENIDIDQYNPSEHTDHGEQYFPESIREYLSRRQGSRRLDLLVVLPDKSSRPIGLWADELVEVDEMDARMVDDHLEALQRSHRLIKGRIRIKGRNIYLLNS